PSGSTVEPWIAAVAAEILDAVRLDRQPRGQPPAVEATTHPVGEARGALWIRRIEERAAVREPGLVRVAEQIRRSDVDGRADVELDRKTVAATGERGRCGDAGTPFPAVRVVVARPALGLRARPARERPALRVGRARDRAARVGVRAPRASGGGAR